MSYFRTRDGCSLYYETVGGERSRPMVVFLNGTLQTTMYWKAIAASLKPGFRALLYDARGQGESELGDAPLSLDLHMADLTALLRHLELSSVNLVGVSHGALLGYAMARQYPNRIDRLVLCAIGVRSSMRSRLIVGSWLKILEAGGLAAMVEAAMPHVFGEAFLVHHRKHLDRIVKTLVRRNRESSLIAHLTALGDYPGLRSMLQPLGLPLLVLCGADDPLVSAAGAAEVAEKSGGRHMVVDGAGHSIPAEVPEFFLETIRRFLADRWTDMPEGI